MTEREFLIFLERLREKGRIPQVSAIIDHDDPEISSLAGYLQDHALLPQNYDRISNEDIIGMGSLLFRKEVSSKSKEAILIILAHYPSETTLTILTKYNFRPDKGLEFFAKMALEECAMRNE